MPPWKSQRVQGQRQSDGPSTVTQTSSISASPFRQAKVATSQANGELPIELLSSPSRGLDISDSTRDLTNEATQAKYRAYISQRLRTHCDKYGPLLNESRMEPFPLLLPGTPNVPKWSAAGAEGAALGSLQDILLLVRRLREGCVAASRRDGFAIDVYALSTLLSLLIGDDIQLSSSLPRLLDLVLNVTSPTSVDVAQDIRLIVGLQTPSHFTTILLEPGHVASLYLLWLIESGGQASRIGGAQKASKGPGGAWLQERNRIVESLEEKDCRWLRIAEDIHHALKRGNVFQLRRILIQNDLSIWQRALVRRSVQRIREENWTILTKAYLHAPFDGLLIEGEKGGDDWLERVLFIDTEIMPLPKVRPAASNISTPEEWDDSMEELAATLETTTLEQDASTIHLRASRIAAVFEAFHLPSSPSTEASDAGPLNNWMGRKVLQAGAPTLKLR